MTAAAKGRPRVGRPISITLTDEQRAWLESQIPPGGTFTQAVRAVIQAAMERAPKRRAR